MKNVFDSIDALYNHDLEVKRYLKRSEYEGYLRMRSWQGDDEELLFSKYESILLLIFYLKITERNLSQLDRDEIIDAVAWLGRNFPGFNIDEQVLTIYLERWDDLFHYLSKKRSLKNVNAVHQAKELLLPQGKLALINKEGEFLDPNSKYALCASVDFGKKILLDAYNNYSNIKGAVKAFFQQECFTRDYRTSLEKFDNFLAKLKPELAPDTRGHEEMFWQYFLFEYRMLRTDQTPIQYFQSKHLAEGKLKWSKDECLVLDAMQKSQLRLFTIVEEDYEDIYVCEDFLTKERFTAIITAEEPMEHMDWLFLSHFYGDVPRAMDCMSSVDLPEAFRRKMLHVLEGCRSLIGVSWGHQPTWPEFMERYPLFVQFVLALYSTYVMLDAYNFQTKLKEYHPAAMPQYLGREFLRDLHVLQRVKYVSDYDMRLVANMAADFTSRYRIEPELEATWAVAIMETFLRLNRMSGEFEDAKLEAFYTNECAAKIKEVLHLEPFDPRYVNEYGLMAMMIEK